MRNAAAIASDFDGVGQEHQELGIRRARQQRALRGRLQAPRGVAHQPVADGVAHRLDDFRHAPQADHQHAPRGAMGRAASSRWIAVDAATRFGRPVTWSWPAW